MPKSVLTAFFETLTGGILRTATERWIDGIAILIAALVPWLLHNHQATKESFLYILLVICLIIAVHVFRAIVKTWKNLASCPHGHIEESILFFPDQQRHKTFVTETIPPYFELKLIVIGVISLGLLALPSYLAVHYVGMSVAQPDSAKRAEEFEAINQFISEKSEDELRDMFDFPRIERDGIAMAQAALTPEATNQADIDQAKRDSTNGGRLAFFYRYIDTATPNQVKMIKGKWGILVLTPKYASNWDSLGRHASSVHIPKEVADALKDLQKTTQDNTEVLIDAINEAYTMNPDALANAYKCPKTHCLVINNDLFYPRFINLKPKADAVTNAIRGAEKRD